MTRRVRTFGSHPGRVRWQLPRSLFGALLIALCCTGTSVAQVVGRSPRVLILYPYDERIPATAITGETARVHLLDVTDGKIDLFSEFLDLSRFPEQLQLDRMASFLAEKYRDHRPDVVIALGEESARFIAAHKATIAPDAKIIFCGFSGATASSMKLPEGMVGASSEFEIAKTLDMARGLQPKAKHLFVLGGSSTFDRAWLDRARRDLAVSPRIMRQPISKV